MRRLWLALCVLLVSGCSTTLDPGYYWQSVSGHLHMVRAARPVDDWLADTQTSAALRLKLQQAQQLRRFAVTDLGLPDNASYTRYADLQRRAAVWNVVAAPDDALKLKQWCFLALGCVGYRGYFDEAEARAFAARVREGEPALEVGVYPVPAYSTLGWTNWMGGDPLLSTFIGYPEGELARLIFHELAHQVVYVRDDTVFNESFATAVERLGGARWQATASEAARTEYARFDERRQQFRSLARQTRQALQDAYALPDRAQRLAAKQLAMDGFRAGYQALKQRWNGFAGFDAWANQANNALFAAQAAYDELVPAFEALFEREGRDFARFYDAVRALARLPKDERRSVLLDHRL
jgi:predicted aminopeptidase